MRLQLGLITEERDCLQNFVKELKEHKNVEGGTELATGAIVQVEYHSYYTFEFSFKVFSFFWFLLFMSRSLKHLLPRRKTMSGNWKTVYQNKRKLIAISTMR